MRECVAPVDRQHTVSASVRPNEAATGEGKQQEKQSSQDRQTMPSECGKKHKPQKKLPAIQQQQNHNNNKERAQNEEEEAEKNVNVREKFGLKFAYDICGASSSFRLGKMRARQVRRTKVCVGGGGGNGGNTAS